MRYTVIILVCQLWGEDNISKRTGPPMYENKICNNLHSNFSSAHQEENNTSAVRPLRETRATYFNNAFTMQNETSFFWVMHLALKKKRFLISLLSYTGSEPVPSDSSTYSVMRYVYLDQYYFTIHLAFDLWYVSIRLTEESLISSKHRVHSICM